jgi:WD40 repeat protein
VELEWALSLGKHVIPILHREVSSGRLRPEVQKLNWITPRAPHDEAAVAEVMRDLLPLLESEYEPYVWQHTALTVAAQRWEAADRPTRLLLVGEERRRAEEWLQKTFQPPKQPPVRPTSLQCEFLCEGRKNAEQLMTDVFICAAREDRALRDTVARSLARYLITAWTGADADRPGREAEQLALEGVERADNLLFLLSPASVASAVCAEQLARALELNKRVIPLLVGESPRDTWPEPLRALKPADFTDNTTVTDYERDILDLRNELAENRDYHRQHKLLLVQALRWQRRRQIQGVSTSAFVLRGYALERAQAWVEVHDRADTERAPLTDLHREFVVESARHQRLGVDVFLSYSRKDGDFARVLCERLKDAGRTTWFDQESIAAGADYQAEIFRGIDEADNIVFVVSPDSVASPHCEAEVEHAIAQGKRIRTVLCRATDPAEIPESLASIQWIDCTAYDWSAQFPELLLALDVDREHAAHHTVLQGRAREWDERGRDEALLLNRVACETASAWLAAACERTALPEPDSHGDSLGAYAAELTRFLGAPRKKPHPTEVQIHYVAESRVAIALESLRQRQNTDLLTKRLQRFRIALALALAALVCAGIFYWSARESEQKAEANAQRAADKEREAILNAERAKSERARAETQRDQARANNLAFVSNGLIESGDVSRALAVAARAYELPGGAEAPSVQQALSHAFAELRFGNRGLYHRLFRHGASVDVASVSADGRTILTAAKDGSVKLWNEAGDLIRAVDHGAGVRSASWLSTGKRGTDSAPGFVTVGDENLVKIWKPGAEEPIPLPGHECGGYGNCAVVDVAVSPNATTIVTVGVDAQVLVWDTNGRQIARGLEHQPGWLSTVSFSPDGNYFTTAAGQFNPTVQIYDAQGRHLFGTNPKLRCSERAEWDCRVTRTRFSPVNPGQWLAGFPDRIIRLHDKNGQLLRAYPAKHGARINDLAYHPGGERFVSCDQGGRVIVWTSKGEPVVELEAHEGAATALAVSPDGGYFATGGEDSVISLWRFDGTLASHFRGHAAAIRSLEFTPDSKKLLSSSADKTARLWRIAPMTLPEIVHEKSVAFASFVPGTKHILTVEGAGTKEPGITVRLWTEAGEPSPDGTTYVQSRRYDELGGDDYGNFRLYSLDVSVDGRRFLTASTDYQVRLWDVQTSSPVAAWEDRSGRDAAGWAGVRVARFSRDGRLIATGDFGGHLRLLAADGSLLGEVRGAHPHPILALDFAPGEERLVTADAAGEVKVWRIDGQALSSERTLLKHRGQVNSVQFDPSGRRVLTASDDTELRLTDLEGRNLATAAHADRVLWAEYADEAGTLLSASADGTAVVWDGRLRRIRALEGNTGPIHSARFGPDGTIVTAGQDGRARIWFDPAKINAWLSSPEREVYRLSCADQQELGLVLEGCP